MNWKPSLEVHAMPDAAAELTEADLLPDAHSNDAHLSDAPTVDALTHEAATRRRRRSQHVWMLGLCLFAVASACSLQVVSGEYVAFRFLPRFPLPHSCVSRALFKFDCPGCGLTRSFVLLAEGRVAESYARHHVGIVLALAVLLQIPYRTLSLWRPEREWISRPWGTALAYLLVGLLIGNWLIRLIVPGF